MNKIKKKRGNFLSSQEGFSLPEIVIVVLVLAIIAVLALPQITASRDLFRFSGMQREIMTVLTEARQEAMSQRTPITFRYTHGRREVRIYGGTFGKANKPTNIVYDFDDTGLVKGDIRYGRPGFASTDPLSDGTNLTDLTSGKIEITFQSDGSVLDTSGNPQDFALFFFHKEYRKDTPFAVSVLGAGGRVKLWKYNSGTNTYVE